MKEKESLLSEQQVLYDRDYLAAELINRMRAVPYFLQRRRQNYFIRSLTNNYGVRKFFVVVETFWGFFMKRRHLMEYAGDVDIMRIRL